MVKYGKAWERAARAGFAGRKGTRMEQDELLEALKVIGCPDTEIRALAQSGNPDYRRLLAFLAERRTALLEEVHRSEGMIDCLDYLVYQIKRGRLAPHTRRL